ncbi:MAG: type I methionyl aminopeptidase [Firmicutes bacterium]|nr:type I methionyl aminopeptidase [Bacillota bacterium]
MITIKSAREIKLMQQASQILVQARQALFKMIQPGISTEALDQHADTVIRSLGGIPSFKDYEGYPKSICTSVNEVVIHGIPSSKIILNEGDIISIDIGVNVKGYHADSAFTYAVGNISSEAKQLLEITEKALYIGIEEAKPGNYVSNIGHAIETFIKPYGYGIVETFTGHGIGKELHEEPQVLNYGPKNQGPKLKPGMTICIEPMVNLGTKDVQVLKDGWTVVTKDKRLSAHFEHMVLITEDGCEIMTTLKE